MKKLNSILLLAILGLSVNLKAQTPNLIWAKHMGASSTSGLSVPAEGRFIAVDVQGNVYTTGTFVHIADFDPGPGIFNLETNNFYDIAEIFVSKLDVNGNFLWAKQFRGDADVDDLINDYSNSIVVDANNNVYITGYFTGQVDFDPGLGVYDLNSSNGIGFVSKLDSMGNYVWTKQIPASGNYLAVNSFGNVSITGTFGGSVGDFDPGSGIYPLDSSHGDIFDLTLDVLGNFVWAKQFGGHGMISDESTSIAVDANGNVYTTGYFLGTADFDPSITESYNLTSSNQEDIFVSKLDANGNFVWAKDFKGSFIGMNLFTDVSNSIAVDGNGNAYTTGYFQGTVDFDPSENGTSNLITNDIDIFVSKLNTNGDFVWAKKMGGTTYIDQGRSIAVDANGNVYTTGIFAGTSDFDPGTAIHNLISADINTTDIFVSKLDANGNFVWAGHLGGIYNDFDNSITVNVNENVYTTGQFKGISDFDPGNGTYNLPSCYDDLNLEYYPDIFVAKLCFIETPTITGPTTFCQGSSITLTASTASSYLWSNGMTTQNINVSTSGNYSVTVSNASGCSAASTTITVIGNSYPPIPTITAGGTTTFCQGGSVMLTASLANSYLWSNGATTQTITVTSSGDYKVTVSNATGCSTSSTGMTTVTVLPLPPPVNVTADGPTTFCQGGSVILSAGAASSYLWSNGSTTQNITVSTSGNYTVTVMNANGCSASSTATMVTVHPLPIATITSSGPISFCQGNSVTLTAGPASSYLWSNGSTTQNITVSSSGNYTITVMNAGGCSASSVATSVTVNPLPLVDLGVDTILQQGQQIILDATGPGLTYFWSTGATTPTITVNSMGTYAVTVTNSQGCTSFDTIVVTFTTSTSDQRVKFKITVSPNPTDEIIHITCQGGSTSLAQIIDNLGKVIIEDTALVSDGVKRTLSLEKMPSGIYYLRLVGNGFTKTVSIVKQ
ncbi:MAG: SBBP repeat-containing protein [Saprospiraceae bacterium]|uniref:SBBP repeat-containing protein n=1 Tax=Candidatus Opimibacter skivensis TaxID=2982028 RepID=A0A9D7SVB9_9BACT|nr:SBBP repeat-containing protein [Candidatus Opimibacter skivensis]